MKKTRLYLGICCMMLSMLACEKEIPVNKPPTVSAGNDTTLIQQANDEMLSVTLNGTANDPDGTVISYLWRQSSGLQGALISNATAATTMVSRLLPGKYIFTLTATDEEGATGTDSLLVTVTSPVNKTLLLRPGPDEAQSCLVAWMHARDDHPYQNKFTNHNTNNDISASAWTFASYDISDGLTRTFFKFTGLSVLDASRQVLSAKLTLYGLKPGTAHYAPQGNSYYPGSPYNGSGTNPTWLKGVTGDWNGSTITWVNMPGTTTVNQVPIPPSTAQWAYNVIDLDVTALVKEMVSTSKNYGFCLQMQTERYYRNVSFGSSKSPDAAVRPKLVVVYK